MSISRVEMSRSILLRGGLSACAANPRSVEQRRELAPPVAACANSAPGVFRRRRTTVRAVRGLAEVRASGRRARASAARSTAQTAATAWRRNESDAAWIAPGGLASISAWRNTAARAPALALIAQRVDADLGAPEVEVVHGALGRNEPEAQLGERPLGVDQDHRAVGIAGVVGEVAGQHRALAAALAADQRVPELAVRGRDRDRAVLVVHEHAAGVAVDPGGCARAPDGGAQQRAVLDAAARELPERGELGGREHAGAQAGQRVGHRVRDPSRRRCARRTRISRRTSSFSERSWLKRPATRRTDGAVLAGDAQVEEVERAVLGLERALELLGLDDGVDAELARVAVVGVLERRARGA